MKKNLILSFILLFAFVVDTTGQNPPPPKLRVVTGYLRTDLLLDGKKATYRQVQLQLNKTNPVAGNIWEKSRHQSRNSLCCALVGLGGSVAAVYAAKPNTRISGGAVAIAGFSGAAVYAISSKVNQKRAKNRYNKEYGY